MKSFHSVLQEFGIAVKVFTFKSEIEDFLSCGLQRLNEPFIISFVNSHAVMLALSSDKFLGHVLRSNLVLLDGVGLGLALKSIGVKPGLNMNGTDFIPLILNRCDHDKKICLFGSSDENVMDAKKNLLIEGFTNVRIENGFRPADYYASVSKKYKPDVVILGMGMPKQEEVAHEIARTLIGHGTVIINGGAIIDFLSGNIKRAPLIFRKLKLEWLFRLALEPVRLLPRLVWNFKFIFTTAVIYLRRCYGKK